MTWMSYFVQNPVRKTDFYISYYKVLGKHRKAFIYLLFSQFCLTGILQAENSCGTSVVQCKCKILQESRPSFSFTLCKRTSWESRVCWQHVLHMWRYLCVQSDWVCTVLSLLWEQLDLTSTTTRGNMQRVFALRPKHSQTPTSTLLYTLLAVLKADGGKLNVMSCRGGKTQNKLKPNQFETTKRSIIWEKSHYWFQKTSLLSSVQMKSSMKFVTLRKTINKRAQLCKRSYCLQGSMALVRPPIRSTSRWSDNRSNDSLN